MINSPVAASPASGEFRQLLEEVYRGRHVYPYSTGQSIPMQSHEILLVFRGIVQLSTFYSNGDEAILGLACPSMPFGLPLTLVQPYEAKALSDVVVMRLHQMEIEQSPRLAQGIFRQLRRRAQQTEALLSILGERRIEDRLRHLLLLLQREIGQVTEGGVRISIRLTHQQLASLIGTTRVTITRLLRQFREEGFIRVEQRNLVVNHPSTSVSSAFSEHLSLSGL